VKKRIELIESINNGDDYYIAVDIRKKNCVVCVADKEGSIIEETKYDNTLQEAERFASQLDKKYSNRKCQFVNQQPTCGSRHTKHLRNMV
jgi:predicted NBD/HSP70 family sugar kinase